MTRSPIELFWTAKKLYRLYRSCKKSLIYNISKITTKLVLCKKIHVLYSVYFSNLPENSNGHHFSTDATSNVLLAPVQLTGRKLFPATCSASNTLLVAQFTVTDQHSRRVFATLSPHVSQFDNWERKKLQIDKWETFIFIWCDIRPNISLALVTRLFW